MKLQRFIPDFLRYFICVFLSVVLLMLLGRVVIAVQHWELLPVEALFWVKMSFWNGIQFDFTIASYVVALPFLIYSVLFILNKESSALINAFKYYFNALMLVILALVVSDIPFFNYYNSRLTKGVLTWMDSPEAMTDAFLGEDAYYPYLAAFIILLIALFYLNNRFVKAWNRKEKQPFTLFSRVVIFLCFGFFLFIGVRGGADFSDKPITTERAIISDHSFVNQLAMNPVFNFMNSFRNPEMDYMTEERAIETANNYLQVTSQNGCSPISRMEYSSETENHPNVVLILVESLSSYRVGHLKAKENITPNIDSLAKQGMYFTNFYANGIHTHNGIFSSLYALPAILNNKPMSDSYLSQIEYTGLPLSLKKQGYQTAFYCTGDLKFDNMGAFLSNHGFDHVYGRDYYKKEDLYNAWGVHDKKLYDYVLDGLDKVEKPFFTTVLTVSSHDGYNDPQGIGYERRSENSENWKYEFTDWAIGQFLKNAAQKTWFDNTIFVILGDHGQNFDPVYNLPLSYIQIPLVIYAPKFIPTQEVHEMGMQIDLFPTLLNLMGKSFENNTMGVNLMKESRPFVYASSDDYLAVLDSAHYLLINNDGLSLYNYTHLSRQNVAMQKGELVINMQDYMYSMLQTTQYLMKENKLGFCKP